MKGSALPRLASAAQSAAALGGTDPRDFIGFADDEVGLPCRLKLLPGADRAFVMLNGAAGRSKRL